MHTYIKEVNGLKIYHWTLGDTYYFKTDDEQDWTFEDKNLKLVEEVAENYPN
jgi:hypothetical protein